MPKRVLVAMSGGVDSSVAAALLKDQGYDLVGTTMQVWPSQPGRVGGCCSLESVTDAQKVCAALKIPHYTLNYRDYFQKTVIDDFVKEYQAGRTPNPCIRCNQFLKFEALLKKADELKCDFIATGHYARIMKNDQLHNDQFRCKLYKGADTQKDQSYVLYVMTQTALARTLFPLGELTKKMVRQIARDKKLPVAEKPESQEICFIEDNNYARFLKEKASSVVKPGEIVDTRGKVVGRHEGIAFYTIGQRKGIGFFGAPKYVVKLDLAKNQVVVGNREEASRREMIVANLNFPGGNPFAGATAEPLRATVKIRSQSLAEPALLEAVAPTAQGEARIRVIFDQAQFAVTPGQSAVFYSGEEVLGGGIIS